MNQKTGESDGTVERSEGGAGPAGMTIVKPGETLAQIAERHGITLHDLLSANPHITAASSNRPGLVVILPEHARMPPSGS